MTAKPRLLVVTSTFPLGPDDAATPPFVLQLCTRLAQEFDVDVLAPHSPGALARERLHGVDVVRYRYAPERFEILSGSGGILGRMRASVLAVLLVPSFLAGQWLALVRLLRSGRYAAVHAHWILPQGLLAAAALALARRKLPLLVTVHGSDAFALKGALARALRRWTARRAAAVAVVSAALRDQLAQEFGDGARLRVLPMGVDLAQRFVPAPGTPREPATILYAGRLKASKGPGVLLEALAQLRKTHPATRLQLAGSGPEEAALRGAATRLGLDGQVSFLGAVPQAQLADCYRRASVVAFPSLEPEGLGLVPIEALGCECAVVASNVPGVTESIVHGTTGLLARPGSAADLAAQLGRLLDDPALARRLGRQGRDHVLRYDWLRAAGAYAGLLRSVMSP